MNKEKQLEEELEKYNILYRLKNNNIEKEPEYYDNTGKIIATFGLALAILITLGIPSALIYKYVEMSQLAKITTIEVCLPISAAICFLELKAMVIYITKRGLKLFKKDNPDIDTEIDEESLKKIIKEKSLELSLLSENNIKKSLKEEMPNLNDEKINEFMEKFHEKVISSLKECKEDNENNTYNKEYVKKRNYI